MQTTKQNRRGLALGAIVALLGSLFGAVPANAAATEGAQIAIRPMSNLDISNFTGLITEDFPIYAELLPGVSTADFDTTTLKWKITRVSGAMDVVAQATTVSANAVGVGNYTMEIDDLTQVGSTSSTVETVGSGISATNSEFVGISSTEAFAQTIDARVTTANTGIAPLFIRATSASGVTSSSPDTVVQVTAFLDTQGGTNGVLDADEWYTTVTITLKGSAGLAPTLSLASMTDGDTYVTASATLAGMNWSNLNGKPFLALTSSHATNYFSKSTAAADGSVTSSAITGTQATNRTSCYRILHDRRSKRIEVRHSDPSLR